MNDPIHNIGPKVVASGTLAFAGFTISEWAALAGLVYTLLLIGEWLWKRLFKDIAISHGWIKPKDSE